MSDPKRDDELTADDRHSRLDQQHDRAQQAADRAVRAVPAPPPRASPVPQMSNDPDDALHTDTPSGVYRVVRRTAWHTKVQWGVVGAFLVAVGSFVNYSIGKLDVVNSAMAQTQERGSSHGQKLAVLEQRIEAVDAGSRSAIERLERKIDANNEQQQKKIDDIAQTMKEVLREVRKR